MNWNIEELAETVREAWIAWARTQRDPKPSWLVPWAELSEPDREADRFIARALLDDILGRIVPTNRA